MDPLYEPLHDTDSSRYKDPNVCLHDTHQGVENSAAVSKDWHAMYSTKYSVQGFKGSFSKFKDFSRILQNFHKNSTTYQGFKGFKGHDTALNILLHETLIDY